MSNDSQSHAKVTAENWDELRQAGFEFLSNIGRESYVSGPDENHYPRYLNDLRKEHGPENVKLGHPMNKLTGHPDPDFGGGDLLGVYAKRR
ncbi:MAG TPA: hypothetical protein VD907_00850 [Verrucomicrobiae bacterium]|nr:hypothetical protein [Verrucomicrobiae bacterium]